MKEDESRLSTIIAFQFVPFTTTFQNGIVSGWRSDFGNILVVRFEFVRDRRSFKTIRSQKRSKSGRGLIFDWQERIMPSTIS